MSEEEKTPVVPTTETPCTDGTCAPEVEETTTEAPAAEEVTTETEAPAAE